MLEDTSFEEEFERRTSERKPYKRGALLCINGLSSFFELTVRDVSDRGIASVCGCMSISHCYQ